MTCHACKGTEFRRQAVGIPVQVGEQLVLDSSAMLPVCQTCGEYVVPAKIHAKIELRAAIAVLHDAPKVSGAMLKFARKALGMTQVELAALLGSAPESVSRWERERLQQIEPWVTLSVLGLLRERIMPPLDGVELKKAV